MIRYYYDLDVIDLGNTARTLLSAGAEFVLRRYEIWSRCSLVDESIQHSANVGSENLEDVY